MLVTAPRQSSRSPANSLMAAIEPGHTQQWYSLAAGWTGYKNLSLELSQNKNQITLTATNNQNQQFRGTLNANDKKLVKWLGSEGTAFLLRIDAGPAQFNLQPVTASNSSSTSGWGRRIAAGGIGAIRLRRNSADRDDGIPLGSACHWVARRRSKRCRQRCSDGVCNPDGR